MNSSKAALLLFTGVLAITVPSHAVSMTADNPAPVVAQASSTQATKAVDVETPAKPEPKIESPKTDASEHPETVEKLLVDLATATEYDARLKAWLEILSEKESGNRADIKVLDVNGKYSYGCLQFQKATFDAYSKRYGMSGDIYDCEFQKRLAARMINESYSNWKHWSYTVTKVNGAGKPPTT